MATTFASRTLSVSIHCDPSTVDAFAQTRRISPHGSQNQKEVLLAFRGKRRGFCPSCAGRRMAQTAAPLVACVMPWIPTRSWAVSVPIPLRDRMAASQDLTAPVHTMIHTTMPQDDVHQAVTRGVARPQVQPGAMTCLQRGGGARHLPVQVHVVLPPPSCGACPGRAAPRSAVLRPVPVGRRGAPGRAREVPAPKDRLFFLSAQERHLTLSVDLLLERLRGMQEALVVYANGTAQRVLTQRSPEQEEVFVALNFRPLAEQLGNTVLAL